MSENQENISVDAMFEQLAGFVAECRRLLSAGAMTDLAGMEVNVEDFCLEILKMSPEERLIHEPKLQALLSDLDLLAQEMMQAKAQLGAQILGASQVRRANVAYRTSDAVDNYKKPKDE